MDYSSSLTNLVISEDEIFPFLFISIRLKVCSQWRFVTMLSLSIRATVNS